MKKNDKVFMIHKNILELILVKRLILEIYLFFSPKVARWEYTLFVPQLINLASLYLDGMNQKNLR